MAVIKSHHVLLVQSNPIRSVEQVTDTSHQVGIEGLVVWPATSGLEVVFEPHDEERIEFTVSFTEEEARQLYDELKEHF